MPVAPAYLGPGPGGIMIQEFEHPIIELKGRRVKIPPAWSSGVLAARRAQNMKLEHYSEMPRQIDLDPA